VRKDFVELRTAKQQLEKMLADGTFAFTRKVDATSFKILCTILAEGDVAKASRRLGITDSMMRYTLTQRESRGQAYGAMLDLVRWRKRVGRKETLASMTPSCTNKPRPPIIPASSPTSSTACFP